MIAIEEIRAARERIAGAAVRTPLVRLPVADAPCEIWCKLETLQPVNSFKIRGAANCVRAADPALVSQGLVTASAGNAAQGVAWMARELGVPATIAVPEHAPATKLDAIARLGGSVVKLPYADWWQAIVTSRVEGVEGFFVHPVSDPAVMAGNGTIGLEILEQAPDVTTVFAPVSGGGLLGGLAAAIKQSRPEVKVIGVEPELANDAQQSFRTGEVVTIPAEQAMRTIADGLRVQRLGARTWPHIRAFVDDIVTVSEAEIAAAIRRIAGEARLIAEPSGAVATAGALASAADPRVSVAVVSGGNIDREMLAEILAA